MGWTGELLNIKWRKKFGFVKDYFRQKFESRSSKKLFPLNQLSTENIQISSPRRDTRETVNFAHRAPETPPTTSKLVSDSDLLLSYEKALSSARIPSYADLRLSTGPPGNHDDSECGWLRSAVISVTWTIKHPSRNPFLRRFSKNIMT